MLLGITSINYGSGSNATLCVKCSSLPVWLSRWVFNGSLLTAALIALVILLALVILFFTVRASLAKGAQRGKILAIAFRGELRGV